MERKGEGKPPETLCFLSKKRKGVEAYSLLPQAELRPVQYSTQSALGGGVLSCSESTPVLQGSHHILFTIVCGWRKKKKKKRREHWRERKPASLCRKRERELVFICAGQKKQDIFPPHQLQGASSLVLRGHGCICVSFSGRQTATPRLLLMMRADVRLVSMNIDVEDSLFHRRTERGKMAAL